MSATSGGRTRCSGCRAGWRLRSAMARDRWRTPCQLRCAGRGRSRGTPAGGPGCDRSRARSGPGVGMRALGHKGSGHRRGQRLRAESRPRRQGFGRQGIVASSADDHDGGPATVGHRSCATDAGGTSGPSAPGVGRCMQAPRMDTMVAKGVVEWEKGSVQSVRFDEHCGLGGGGDRFRETVRVALA